MLIHLCDPDYLLLYPVRLITNLIKTPAYTLNRSQAVFNAAGQLFNSGDNQGGIRSYFLQRFCNFAGGLSRSARQLPHLIRYNRKSTTLLACSRRFYGRIEREKIGLSGDAFYG